MPSLSFFADTNDVGLLVQRLNEDPEVAFFVPLAPIDVPPPVPSLSGNRFIERTRWQAVHTVPSLSDGQHSLWHVPTGELLKPVPSGKLAGPPSTPIADPWSGWTGRAIVVRNGSRDVIPEVESGPGYQGIIRLDLSTRHLPYSAEERAARDDLWPYWLGTEEFLAYSGFQWIGGHYRPALKETTRWWNGLKRWLGRSCAKLTDPTGRQAFYAFPSAFQLLQSGIKYASANWNLDASIQVARLP